MAYRMTLLLPKGARGLRRKFAEVRKQVLQEVGEYWHKVKLPLHFRADATRRYRYPKRTAAHLKRKRREGRGEDPNVYTGQMRDKVTSTRPAYRVSRGGITLTWRGLPRHTFMTSTHEFVSNDRRWNDAYVKTLPPEAQAGIMRWREAHPETKGGRFKLVRRPDKAAELTTINREDANDMAKFARQAMSRGLRDYGKR